MAQKTFGSADSTGRKLAVIEKYLFMYQKALSNTRLRTIYIDGFAGSGEVPLWESEENLLDEEVKTVLAGSADRAVNISPPFSRYVFVDKRKKCIDALDARLKSRPNFDRVTCLVGDANEEIGRLCREERWRAQRGVVFLDPFGSQVRWATIEAIAATNALDLWYLFPAGLSVFRQIANDGTVQHREPITRLFGTDEWMNDFFAPSSQGDLFGRPAGQKKNVTPESAAQYMVKRLRSVFRGGVLDEMIPLGRHAYPSYYLIFAWANPSPKATLAKKLARAAIKATDRKHGRLV